MDALAAAPGTQLGPLAVGRGSVFPVGPISWGFLRNAAVDGANTLYRTSAGTGFGASGGNSSSLVLPGDGAFYSEVGQERVIAGLSVDRAEVYTSIDFGWYTRDTGQFYAAVNGSLVLLSTWSRGDEIKIDARSGVAKLYKNDVDLYTYVAAATGPFWVCADLYQLNAAVVAGEILP